MFDTFILTVNQLINMFTFMAVGFFMRKKKIGGEGVSAALSALLVNIFLPALVFLNFSENFRIKDIAENITFLWFGIGSIAVTFFVAKGLSKIFAKNQMQKDVYMYSFLIPNLGYMGYPLVEAVFGEQALFYMLVFVIPYNIMIYTYGMYILNPNREFSIKKLLNPSIIAMILGIIAGIFEVNVPGVVKDVLTSAKGCMSPSAMILTGFVLASAPVKPLLKDAKLYAAALLRGIVIPGVALILLLLCGAPKMCILIVVATLSLPMGLNSVVFPEAYGGDGLTGAKTSYVSNMLCLITLPVMFALIGLFCK